MVGWATQPIFSADFFLPIFSADFLMPRATEAIAPDALLLEEEEEEERPRRHPPEWPKLLNWGSRLAVVNKDFDSLFPLWVSFLRRAKFWA